MRASFTPALCFAMLHSSSLESSAAFAVALRMRLITHLQYEGAVIRQQLLACISLYITCVVCTMEGIDNRRLVTNRRSNSAKSFLPGPPFRAMQSAPRRAPAMQKIFSVATFILLKDASQAIKMHTKAGLVERVRTAKCFSGRYKYGKKENREKENHQEKSQKEKIGLRIVQTQSESRLMTAFFLASSQCGAGISG